MLPKKLLNKIDRRKAEGALRELGKPSQLIDLFSNDYLGFAKSEIIFNTSYDLLIANNLKQNGATGSRLLSGNHSLYTHVEQLLCKAHNSESALIFNSGYDANIGLFSSIAQRGDIILYDEYAHASIRDGIAMGHSKSYKFKHNNLTHLENMLNRVQHNGTVYVVTESVFSMDGDTPNLTELVKICHSKNAFLIIDEAHAIGVYGSKGEGLIQELGLEQSVFARLITFGKALGCHGAAILCNNALKQYLINFSRSFIYTTALPPHSLATIQATYQKIQNHDLHERKKLQKNIQHFKSKILSNCLQSKFIPSDSAIHCCIIQGNKNVILTANYLQSKGYNVKPILSPTVSKGKERLRFCLHSYNSEAEISEVLQLLATFVA